MHVRGDAKGIAHRVDRSAVEDDALEFFAELLNKKTDVGRSDEFGGIGRACAGGKKEEIFHLRRTDHVLQPGIAGEDVGEPGWRIAGGKKRLVHAGTAEIDIDEQGFVSLLGQHNGGV